jgi:adenylate cyclase
LRPVTVLFADLEGFSSLSEHLNPVQVLDLLNQYHGIMVTVIKRNGGTIDKFLGDGLMAVFNAPIDLADHEFKAVKAALEIQESLRLFHATLEENFRMWINVGINTGMAVVGNVGAADIMDYTAIGDAVNLAARLQTLGKHNQVIISEAVYKQVNSRVKSVLLGRSSVKGREEAVMVYCVTGFL